MDTISPTRIDEIIRESLFNDSELENGKPKGGLEPKLGKGVMSQFGFHPDRLEANRAEVSEMLDLLPDQFHQGRGDGWSFLNMCMDKNDRQWGQHRDMDLLVCLGSALGLMEVLDGLPRHLLPGGMPYVLVTDQEQKG